MKKISFEEKHTYKRMDRLTLEGEIVDISSESHI
jgi:hypothetical protein